MSRSLGLVVACWLILGPAAASRAQTDAAGRYDGGWYGFGVYPDDALPSGAFGMDYVQVVPSGYLMMDRFGMVYQAPVIVSQAAAPLARSNANVNVRRETRPKPARPTTTRRRRPQTPVNYQLPTGSLHWPAGEGVLLYAPALRYQSYGGGAARSPYGTIYYDSMYKGWPLSY
jgi:hypothetical protein